MGTESSFGHCLAKRQISTPETRWFVTTLDAVDALSELIDLEIEKYESQEDVFQEKLKSFLPIDLCSLMLFYPCAMLSAGVDQLIGTSIFGRRRLSERAFSPQKSYSEISRATSRIYPNKPR